MHILYVLFVYIYILCSHILYFIILYYIKLYFIISTYFIFNIICTYIYMYYIILYYILYFILYSIILYSIILFYYFNKLYSIFRIYRSMIWFNPWWTCPAQPGQPKLHSSFLPRQKACEEVVQECENLLSLRDLVGRCVFFLCFWQDEVSDLGIYPLVNIQKTLVKTTIFHG